MPKSCEVVGCTNHNLSNSNGLSFHKFPSRNNEPERRNKWITALKKLARDGSKWSPSKHAVICSAHFVSGKPAVKHDLNHPDWCPSIFPHREYTPGQTDTCRKRKLNRFDRNMSRSCRRLLLEETCGKGTEDDSTTVAFDADEDGDEEIATFLEDSFSSTSSILDETNHETLMNTLQHDAEIRILTDRCRHLEASSKHLQQENDKLRTDLSNAQTSIKKLECLQLTTAIVKENDERCNFYTGLKWNTFQTTFFFLCQFVSRGNKNSMPLMDQFFVTLVKLRQDLNFQAIAYQTGFGDTTVRDYFWKWIDIMYVNLSFLVKFPDPEAIRSTLPPCFKAKFPRLTQLIDCFEVFIEQPRSYMARAQTYSRYKSHNTVKVFLACTPLGAISFISQAWGGRVSDIELVKKSGFFSQGTHIQGDQILADRGFTLQDLAAVYGVELIIPAFTKGKKQLSARDVETSRKIASVRIHVERIIGLLRNKYQILRGTLPVTFINSVSKENENSEFAGIDKILLVCAALTNLSDSIVIKPETEDCD